MRQAPTYMAVLDNLPSIIALSGNNSDLAIDVISEDTAVPPGCAVSVVSSVVSVYIDVNQLVDIDREIEKIEARLAKTFLSAQKVREVLESPGFVQKSSAAVQEMERQRLTDLVAEELSLQQTIGLLQKVE